jgi:[ribosomal protein S18]-alanine N-acetyltransferase
VVRPGAEMPPDLDEGRLAAFLFEALKPWNDTLEDIGRGIEYARSSSPERGGLLLLARLDDELVGACVLLRTGMGGYVPGWLLLFVAVPSQRRGLGIGGDLVKLAVETCGGDLALHVEHDNPAKRLYERVGFVSKYAEMRWSE